MKPLKIVLGVTIAIVVVLAVLVGLDVLWSALMGRIGQAFGIDWLDDISAVWLLAALTLFLPKGWLWRKLGFDRPYTCHGTTDINAPVEAVWDEVRPRVRDDSYQPIMKRIVSVPDQPDRFDFLFDDRFTVEADVPKVLQLRVEESVKHAYLRFGYMNAQDLPLFGKDILSTEIWFESTPQGTRVKYAENFSRLTLVAAGSFFFLNPAKDGLKRLKARCEGTPDTSWMGKTARDSGPRGEPPAEMRKTIATVMASAVGVTVAMTFALVWFITSFVG